MTHLIYFSKNLGKTFKTQKDLLKTDKNHKEVYSDTWRGKKSEWLDYVKNDKLCTDFSYARYTKAMEEITGFGMKDCLSIPGLGWKCFNSLRTEEDEPVYTFNDKYMRFLVRQTIKGRRVCNFNQYYKSKLCDAFLKIISEELNVKRNVFDIIEAFLNYRNKQLKIYEEE